MKPNRAGPQALGTVGWTVPRALSTAPLTPCSRSAVRISLPGAGAKIIQGSGIVRLPDRTSRVVTYAGKNGHRYTAVGAELVRRGALRREEVSMQAIRAWLLAHPAAQTELLATNPSYVFFRFADAPMGSLGLPVTPDRTIAADARVFPKGALAFLETERPVDAASGTFRPFSRFVLDQDAGGAIRTAARVDVYFGSGAYAENAAGRMKQAGRLHYLLLR